MILLDEYFALNVTFVIIMTFFLTKMYYMVDKVVTVMENEFTHSHDRFDFKPSEINIPPPPPPIPDEWFKENQEWLRD
tara:strand:- start:10759 stop:10992 length:234 start_codon:yes stop_codon:yes gene_type:complete